MGLEGDFRVGISVDLEGLPGNKPYHKNLENELLLSSELPDLPIHKLHKTYYMQFFDQAMNPEDMKNIRDA